MLHPELISLEWTLCEEICPFVFEKDFLPRKAYEKNFMQSLNI